jgi:hypothetical protein
MPIPSVTPNPAPSPTQAPATSSNPSTDAGVTFDAAPLNAATPVSSLAPTPSSNQNTDAGMTFDSAPVTKALSVPAQPSQPVPSSDTTMLPNGTVSAVPGSMPGDSMASKVTLWAQNLRNDLVHGTETTDVGKLYKSVGSQPLAAGQGEAVGEFMGSPILVPVRMVQGASELPQSGRRWQGTKDVVGGALDTSSIPGGFASPIAGELAGAGGEAALDAAGNAANATGSKARDLFSLQAVQDALEGSHADIQRRWKRARKPYRMIGAKL